jgi:YEATS domain-containing protein 4
MAMMQRPLGPPPSLTPPDSSSYSSSRAPLSLANTNIDLPDDGTLTTVHCPLVFGSIAFWLGRKADEHATHRWTLYVRGANGEDPSYFISKVVFYLHESFAQPTREITEPPFEVSEMGWGEFEARLRVHWRDAREDPIDFLHTIKLYPPSPASPSVSKPVVHEFYDEIVFTDPSLDLVQAIASGASSRRAAPPHPFGGFYPSYSDAHDVQRIVAAQQVVTEELNRAKMDLEMVEMKKRKLESIVAARHSRAGGGGGPSR